MNRGPHNGRYILVGQTPVSCVDLLEWARWIEDHVCRRVALTRVGPYLVSTVFLGLDHNFNPYGGEPILFETMVMVDGLTHKSTLLDGEVQDFVDDIQERCSTWLEAEAQHKAVVAQIAQPGDSIEEIHDEDAKLA